MKKQTSERRFRCTVCGTIQTAWKKSSKKTKVTHIKTMYCYKCKLVQDFIQISNYGEWYNDKENC